MIDEFVIGKIYKLNTVLSTDEQRMLNPGVIIIVLNIETRTQGGYETKWKLQNLQTRLTFLFDNKIMHCQDYDDRLLNYFNEIEES